MESYSEGCKGIASENISTFFKLEIEVISAELTAATEKWCDLTNKFFEIDAIATFLFSLSFGLHVDIDSKGN